MSIIVGKAATLTLTLKVAGQVVALPPSAVVTAMLLVGDTPVTPSVPLSPTAIGANWSAGVVVVEFSAGQTAVLEPGTVTLRVNAAIGDDDQSWSVPIPVSAGGVQRSALFVRDADLPAFRSGRLAALCGTINTACLSDDYLWELMLEAESAMARDLAVKLQPTEFFPVVGPTPQELAEIGDRPWEIEPGYDCPPNFFSTAQWGITKLRQKLLISIQRVQVVYPSQPTPVFTVPDTWILTDRRGSILQIVPGSSDGLSAPLSVFTLQSMAAGYTVPQMLRVRYTAGLTPDHELYPAVRGLTLRAAAVRVLQNSFIPQSGSISADGLSQSRSMDVSKYQEAIDAEVALLRDRLKGPVWSVL